MPKIPDDYRVLQTKLDEILLKLQSDELDVDEAVKLYEQGLELVKKLEERLANAENKVVKLKDNLSNT